MSVDLFVVEFANGAYWRFGFDETSGCKVLEVYSYLVFELDAFLWTMSLIF